MTFELIPIISSGVDDFTVTVVAAMDDAPAPRRGKIVRPRANQAFDLASLGATVSARPGAPARTKAFSAP